MSVPYVIEKGPGDQERVYDLYSRLLRDRIVFIRGVIDQNLADSIVAQLLFLEANDNEVDINMYINSQGGEIDAMYAIFDTINYVKPDVATMGFGRCISAASLLLAAGTKGKRSILPNTNIMIHELSGGVTGKAGDMRGNYRHIEDTYEKMARHYVQLTGQKLVKVKKDMERDHFLTAEEAVKYGLVDKIQKSKG
ncbi:ATP-dependent Clp protease proteolytic subunit [candidate division WOR-3 bacterium]|nr:ATP-dependent Clp protease proteolytic subunit [candidate division WOR-3 bacterium]